MTKNFSKFVLLKNILFHVIVEKSGSGLLTKILKIQCCTFIVNDVTSIFFLGISKNLSLCVELASSGKC
jgi:hypothetical protein